MFVIKYRYKGDIYLTECEDDEKERTIAAITDTGCDTPLRYQMKYRPTWGTVLSIQHYDGTIEDNQYWR